MLFAGGFLPVNNDESMLHYALVDSCQCIGIYCICTSCLGIMHLFSYCSLNHPNGVVIVPMTTPGAIVATSARRPMQFTSVRRSKALLEESKSACQRGIGRGAKDRAITLSQA